MTALVLSPDVDNYFDQRMARQMLIQIPALLILGFIAGRYTLRFIEKVNENGITGLIIFIGSFLFWMLPRSLDLTVLSSTVDTIMHVNMLIAGFALGQSYPLLGFIIRMAVALLFISMLIVISMVYTNYSTLLCAVYTVEQQKEVGYYLFRGCGALLAGWVFWTIHTIKSVEKINDNKLRSFI